MSEKYWRDALCRVTEMLLRVEASIPTWLVVALFLGVLWLNVWPDVHALWQ